MTCLSTEELAGLYDGTLPAERAAQARSHLAVCPRCAHDFQWLHQVMQSASAPPLPADIVHRLLDNRLARLQERQQPAKPRIRAQPVRK